MRGRCDSASGLSATHDRAGDSRALTRKEHSLTVAALFWGRTLPGGRGAVWGSGLGGERFDQVEDFLVFGEAAHVLLAPDLGAVDVDVEDPARTLDQFGLDLERLLQCVRQTGGSGQVVSLAAVLDADLHRLCCLISTWHRFSTGESLCHSSVSGADG